MVNNFKENILTSEQIKKTLKCCFAGSEEDCNNCPNEITCGEIDIIESTLNLINYLESENNRLSSENDKLKQDLEITKINLNIYKDLSFK